MTHLNHYHPKSLDPKPLPKGVSVKCRYCGKNVKLRGLKDHRPHYNGRK